MRGAGDRLKPVPAPLWSPASRAECHRVAAVYRCHNPPYHEARKHTQRQASRTQTSKCIREWQTRRMSVERRCSRPPEGRADLKNSLRKVHRRASTSGIGTARRRLVDRRGARGHVGQPAASQRVQDGHTGRLSSYLRKHVGDHGHNRAPRAGTRRRRQTPLKVSLRASVRQGSSACTHRESIRIVRALPEHGAAFFGRSLTVSIELEDEQPSR